MRPLLAVGILTLAATAAVVDRVAVVVGNHVITESEVQAELRLTAFLNNEPLDLSGKARREAAERLVDQELIRNEMKVGQYPQPTDADVDKTLRQFRSERYSSLPLFREALEKYGITETQLRDHLRWQLATLQFTDMRFQPGMSAPAKTGADQSANRVREGVETPGDAVEREMDAWLKETRGNTKIRFKQEAFQ